MEEQIMVFSKEWFKKHNKALCWLANAPIIKYWFRWLLRIHKDIPWNEKIDEIMPNAFTYGKKLVLVDCVKLKNGEEVFNHSKKLHRKLKNKGLLVKRLRYQQTTDFRTHEKFGKRLYYGLKPLWYLLHFWDWSTSIQPALNCGFDTLTVYPDYDGKVGATTMDGRVLRSGSGEDWDTTRNHTDGTLAQPATLNNSFVRSSRESLTSHTITRSMFLFDTSSLGAVTISLSVFSLCGNGKAADNADNTSLKIVDCTPASNTTITTADYDQFGTTIYGSLDFSSWNSTDGKYNDITISNTIINKSGITKIGTRTGLDISNTEPAANSTDNEIETYFSDNLSNDPKLVVTYATSSFIPRTMWFN